MTNKELFYFTGRCLALDENPEFKNEIIYKCNNNLISWEEFVLLCSNELVLPAVFIKFRNHNLLEHLPPELAEHLFEIHELNAERNKNILHQVEEITRILNKKNINPLFLKGAANLLDKLYSDVGERILSDIDFLIPESEFLYAAKLLEQEGYSIIYETPDYIETEDLKHYPRLVHPDFEAAIEIHRIPVDTKFLTWFNSEIIEKEKRPAKSDSTYFVSSDRHKIIHNFIHGQLSDQGFLYGFVSLRNIYDLLLLSKREPVLSVLPEIKKQKKAVAYFALSDSILGLNKTLCPKANLAFWILSTKNSLNLNSSLFNSTFRGIIFLAERIFTGYLGRPVKSIFIKKERKAFIGRLHSDEWIHNHISLYTKFFNIQSKKKHKNN